MRSGSARSGGDWLASLGHPMPVFVVHLAQPVDGVQGLDNTLVQINADDGRGADHARIRDMRMSEYIPYQAIA